MDPHLARLGPHSRCVHGGEHHLTRDRGTASGAATPTVNAIDTSVTHLYPRIDELDAALGGSPDRFVYQRYGNPTTRALTDALSALCTHDPALPLDAVATATGMAAVHVALLAALADSDNRRVAASRDCYGASVAIVDQLLPSLGVDGHLVDASDNAAVADLLAAVKPAVLLVETTSNPLLRVVDIAAIARLCRTHGTLLVVDNTFPTPLTCRPLDLGADMELHSATKYIGGHGDAMGGIVVARARHGPALREHLKTTGGSLGSFEAWLLHRGLKTLPLRYRQQCRNAEQLAAWLQEHPRIARVVYPGLPDHPEHERAREQFDGRFGAMLAFEIEGADQTAVFRFMEHLRLVQPGTSLGDCYTLVLYPAHASHRALTPAQRRAVGISDGLVRLSAGTEDVEDLIEDLSQALAEQPAPNTP